jgi:hypothetical protein
VQVYDLKGSTTRRIAAKKDLDGGKQVCKDLDVIANHVFFTIGRHRKKEVIEQVMNNVVF